MRFQLIPEDRELGWTPFAWLIYLFPIVFGLQYASRPLGFVLAGLAIATFLFLYFRAHWLHGRQQLYCIVGIAVVGLLYSPINAGATTFFVYAAALLGMWFPRRVAVIGIVALMFALGVEVALFGLQPASWIPAAVFAPLIGGINLHFSASRRANARLRLAHDEVERLAKFDERERIARDLHDLLGHTLSVVTLKSELVGRLLPQLQKDVNEETYPAGKLEQIGTEIEDIEALSRRAMNEVRSSVKGYQAHRMQTEIAKARMALAAAQIHLELETGPYALGSEQETVIAHALREAVTNVTRHSRAMQCTIRLRTEANGDFVLQVDDDGRGVRQPPGSGLTGMQQRVAQIGGTFSLDDRSPKSLLGRGTRLMITVPRRSPELLAANA